MKKYALRAAIFLVHLNIVIILALTGASVNIIFIFAEYTKNSMLCIFFPFHPPDLDRTVPDTLVTEPEMHQIPGNGEYVALTIVSI